MASACDTPGPGLPVVPTDWHWVFRHPQWSVFLQHVPARGCCLQRLLQAVPACLDLPCWLERFSGIPEGKAGEGSGVC